MRRILCLLIAFPLLAPAQVPEPSVSTTTSEVLLDFVVRDKHAQILRDLRPEEIQVLEDGVPQKLRYFQFVDGLSAAPASPAPVAAPSLAASPAAPSATVQPTVNELRDISVVSVVITDLDPRGRKLAMDTMRDFIKDELRPSTYVGIFGLGFGTLQVFQPYTNDAQKISAAMSRASQNAMVGQITFDTQLNMPDTYFGSELNAAAGTASDPNGPNGPIGISTTGMGGPAALLAQLMDTSWVGESHDVYADSVSYLTPLRDFVQAQARIPGRKVVLLFSAGLPVNTDTVELLRSAISAANRSNVSIYAVDTLGFTEQSTLDNSRRILQAAARASMQQQLSKVNGGDQTVTPTQVLSLEMGEDSIHADTMGNMAELADGTGGQLLPPSLDLRDPLRRVMEDVRTHYELAYSPSNTTMDGHFRKIQVKVSRPGARVFARSGYYAVPAVNGREIYPFEMATLKALNTTPALHQFGFHVAALQFRQGTYRTQLAFAFQTPTRDLDIVKDGEWLKVHLCVTALIKNEQGRVVQKISKDIPYRMPAAKEAELRQGVVSFTAPFLLAPGRYTMQTAAVDRLSMKASVSSSTLDVNTGSGFSMSDVAVARRVDAIVGPANEMDPLEARGGTITPELSDRLTPDAEGQLRLYAVAYPSQPVDTPIDAVIEIWRKGQLLMRSPASVVQPDANGAASILANLSTKHLQPGNYEAQVSFQYKGETVKKSIAFVVGAGS